MAAPSALLAAGAAALVAVAAVFLLPGPASRLPWPQQRGRFADMILANATIYTADPARPFAGAMAVRAGRVLRVGTYDSLKLARVPLRGVRSKDEFISRVKGAVRDKHPGEWVRGGGWNNDFWGGDFPTAAWLDDISPDNPVWPSRMDGHMGLANPLAMKIAGIDKKTNDPVGGTTVRTTERGNNHFADRSALCRQHIVGADGKCLFCRHELTAKKYSRQKSQKADGKRQQTAKTGGHLFRTTSSLSIPCLTLRLTRVIVPVSLRIE